MNRTIKLLMLSDIFLLTGFGLIDPILAIFLKENLVGGTIFAAGLASALFLMVKSLVQLPISRYVDNHNHNVNLLILGTFIISMVPFIYIFTNHINYVYLAQVFYGIGSGIAYPTWMGIWTTHLDKKHESFEWSIYSTFTGLGTAATAAIGAAVADFLGFVPTFVLVGLVSLTGSMILIGLERQEGKINSVSRHHYHLRRKAFHHNRRHI